MLTVPIHIYDQEYVVQEFLLHLQMAWGPKFAKVQLNDSSYQANFKCGVCYVFTDRTVYKQIIQL